MHRVVSDYTRVDGSENIKVFVRARPLDKEDAESPSDFILTNKMIERLLLKILILQTEDTGRSVFSSS